MIKERYHDWSPKAPDEQLYPVLSMEIQFDYKEFKSKSIVQMHHKDTTDVHSDNYLYQLAGFQPSKTGP